MMGVMMTDTRSLTASFERIFRRFVKGSERPSKREMADAVAWLLSRQVTAGRRQGMFQPLPADLLNSAQLPTGERLKTKLAAWNVFSHEAVRALQMLAPSQEPVRAATTRAFQIFSRQCYAQQHCAIGECAHSAISYMRLLAASDGSSHMTWVDEQLKLLRAHRLSTGRWRRFPFYFTLLALLEVRSPAANAELKHARPACERAVRRASNGALTTLRQSLLHRVLENTDRARSLF